MKLIKMSASMAAVALLAACSGGADDKAADKIETMTENRADQLEQAADNAVNPQQEEALEDRAENVSEMGERKAEEADDKDDATIANQVGSQLNSTTGR